MKWFIVVLLALIPFNYAKPPPANRMRKDFSQYIIGGNDVEDMSQFAYQLSLLRARVHICGASVIGLNWALSAAHCFEHDNHPDTYAFLAGTLNRFEGGIFVNAEQYFVHPLFDPRTYDYDVAVIRSIEPFVGENIEIIPLIDMGLHVTPGTVGVISGWGVTADGGLAQNLQKLDLEIWEHQECFVKWYEEITTNMLCAGGEPGYDSCTGDSGGPLVVDGIQVGIVSTGATTCGINYPGVYVNITHPSIRSFILQRANI